MTGLRIPLAAAFVLTAATFAFAQGSSGTDPDHKGSTGWTGGSRTQVQGTDSSVADQNAAAGQPLMASGVDLLGPPQRFPAAKTPE